VSISFQLSSPQLRKISIREDLLEVADLIELCFSSTLDEDGRDYLRHLRRAAHDAYYLSWLQSAAERLSAPLNGFVWEENGRIVGNLSLIPMLRGGRIVYWIANVAVHPDFRRRGIGRKLTQQAITHLRERGVHSAWLQVRSDNPPAQELYRSLGFEERLRRTTWTAHPYQEKIAQQISGISVFARRDQDWDRQAEWMRAIYPPDVAWNLSLRITRFKPDFWQRVLRWLQGDVQKNWAAIYEDRALAFASWEPARSHSDTLWVAAPPNVNSEVLTALLYHASGELRYRGKPLQVNYPAMQSVEAFQNAGFHPHQTLIWMMASF
jgi:ribosomal protein S18 acetylase RimI-like enzyme